MKATCPNCSQNYDVEATMINETVTCESCNGNFTILDTRERNPCPRCGELILSIARTCKYCQSNLDGTPSQAQVHVTKIDPFAEYHTDIQGKKKGKVTFVGILGIILGVAFIVVGVPLTSKGDGSEGFFTILTGRGICVACFLWARRVPKNNR